MNLQKKRYALVLGTRPEAIKMFPVYRALKQQPHAEVLLCSTGQHKKLLDDAMEVFGMKADYDLYIMQQGQAIGKLGAGILSGLTNLFQQVKPDYVLVHGDTTTGAFAAMAAGFLQIKVGHVEAGLRTFDKTAPFPEELNRQIISRFADIHFAPTESAKNNLLGEGVAEGRVLVTGNTVIDSLLYVLEQKDTAGFGENNLPDGARMILLTTHRRENFGEHMNHLIRALKRILEDERVYLFISLHHNPAARDYLMTAFGSHQRVQLFEAVPYTEFCSLMRQSYLIVTDSGGIQEEAPSLNKPVVVFRDKTERPEGVEAGCVCLAGTGEEEIFVAIDKLLNDPDAYQKMADAKNPYGDGMAGQLIAEYLVQG